ncbi:MAG TPA: hypothetical protein VGM27_25760 [Acidobacteriaceae bacterium]
MKATLLILLALASAGALYVRQAAVEAQAAPARSDAGFAQLHTETAAEDYGLRASNAQKASEIVELLRQGYGKPTDGELTSYIASFEWAKANLRADSEPQWPLDRNIS